MKFSIVLFSAWFAILSPAIAAPVPSFDNDLLIIRSYDGLYRFDDVIDLLEARAVKTHRRRDGPQPVRTPRLRLTVPQGQVQQHHAVGTGHSSPPPGSPTHEDPPNTPVLPHDNIAPNFSGISESHFPNHFSNP